MRWMRMLAEIAKEVSLDIPEQPPNGGANLILDKEPIIVDMDRSRPPMEAELDPAASQWLTTTGGLSNTDESEIFMLLKVEESPGGIAQVAIYAADYRVGFLRLSDSTVFSASLEAGRRSNQPVVTEAILRRHPDGPWRLYLYPPRP
jgi:hypothetical protein